MSQVSDLSYEFERLRIEGEFAAQVLESFASAIKMVGCRFPLSVPGRWAFRLLVWCGMPYLDALAFLEDTFPFAYDPFDGR